jgi:NADPH2:quinone reductase
MRAVVCRAWGTPDTLKIEEVATPEPKPDEVRIRIRAVSVNFADTIMILGTYQTRPDFPFSPGLECAGEVDAVGPAVTRFKAGDRVMAILNYGGFAEYACATESETFAIADDMSIDVAGSFLISYISSHVAIRWQAKLEAGETMLVLGASGGVGLTATEIGKALGAKVIAGASTDAKLAVAKEHGADELINYKEQNLKEEVMRLTDGKGVNVCYDPVGGDLFDPALSSVGWGGRYLVIGFVGGVPQISANRLLVKHRSAMGSSLRYFRFQRPDLLLKSVEELVSWQGLGKISPLVSKTYSLDDFELALNDLIERRATGRVVIKP